MSPNANLILLYPALTVSYAAAQVGGPNYSYAESLILEHVIALAQVLKLKPKRRD